MQEDDESRFCQDEIDNFVSNPPFTKPKKGVNDIEYDLEALKILITFKEKGYTSNQIIKMYEMVLNKKDKQNE